MHRINKIFVSSVLNTPKVSSDLIAKLNLHISNICKIINRFHFIDNNNIPINFLYKYRLHLLYSSKELMRVPKLLFVFQFKNDN